MSNYYVDSKDWRRSLKNDCDEFVIIAQCVECRSVYFLTLTDTVKIRQGGGRENRNILLWLDRQGLCCAHPNFTFLVGPELVIEEVRGNENEGDL